MLEALGSIPDTQTQTHVHAHACARTHTHQAYINIEYTHIHIHIPGTHMIHTRQKGSNSCTEGEDRRL